MALDTTVGGASANSYVSLAEFNGYVATRLHAPAAVTGATDALKETALIMATRTLDAMVPWTGTSVGPTQALAWPRSGMVNRNGFPIATDALPRELKEATSEFAVQMILSDLVANNDVEKQGITSLKAGPVALTFKQSESLYDVLTAATVTEIVHRLVGMLKVVPDAVRFLLVSSWIESSVTDSGKILFESV